MEIKINLKIMIENNHTNFKFPSKFFITGTDTGIGKTVISAILAVGLNADYYKPIQSGLEEISDTEWMRKKTGLKNNSFFDETYLLTKPLSPHASSKIDGITIEMSKFKLPITTNHLIVEGAGGLLVPLNDKDYIIDLIKHFKLPTLLVVRSGLGTINHTLLSLNSLRDKGIEILGVVMNGNKNQGNKEAIEQYGRVKVIAEIENLEIIDQNSLSGAFNKYFK